MAIGVGGGGGEDMTIGVGGSGVMTIGDDGTGSDWANVAGGDGGGGGDENTGTGGSGDGVASGVGDGGGGGDIGIGRGTCSGVGSGVGGRVVTGVMLAGDGGATPSDSFALSTRLFLAAHERMWVLMPSLMPNICSQSLHRTSPIAAAPSSESDLLCACFLRKCSAIFAPLITPLLHKGQVVITGSCLGGPGARFDVLLLLLLLLLRCCVGVAVWW